MKALVGVRLSSVAAAIPLLLVLALAVSAAVLYLRLGGPDGTGVEVRIYATPACSCCRAYAEYLEEEGFSVELVLVGYGELRSLKVEAGVPAELWSCHTALAGGYIVEGHVPSGAIIDLLSAGGEAKGVAVPGMPPGSPGMPGPPGPLVVYSFTGTGGVAVFGVYYP